MMCLFCVINVYNIFVCIYNVAELYF